MIACIHAFGSGCLSQYNQHSWQVFVTSPEMVSLTRNLVDPASSHMLVSRTKPCKSQSKWINSRSADSSLNQLEPTRRNCLLADYWITLVTPKLIHVSKTRTDSTLGPWFEGCAGCN